MKLENLLRHIADNEENSQDWYAGLSFKPKGNPNWEDVINNPDWFSLKPKTRTVNGFEVPAPISKRLEVGEIYYLSDPTEERFSNTYSWSGDRTDEIGLERGLCFSTPETAMANAKAMLGIDPYPSKKEV